MGQHPKVLAAMHEAGRRAANTWLAAGPRVDALEETPPLYAALVT